MLNTIEIKWDLLGAKLASLSDDEQGQFFKGFAFELSKFETKYLIEQQMFSIKDKLNDKEISILEDALSCLWFKED